MQEEAEQEVNLSKRSRRMEEVDASPESVKAGLLEQSCGGQ